MFALASRSGLHQHTSIRSFACFSRRCSSSTLIVSSCMILCRKTCNCALKTRVEQQAHMQTRDGDVRGSLEVGSATCAWKSWKSCSCDWRSANSIALLVLTVTLRESQRRSGKSRCNAARRQGAAGTQHEEGRNMTYVVTSSSRRHNLVVVSTRWRTWTRHRCHLCWRRRRCATKKRSGMRFPRSLFDPGLAHLGWRHTYADCTRSTHCVLHPASFWDHRLTPDDRIEPHLRTAGILTRSSCGVPTSSSGRRRAIVTAVSFTSVHSNSFLARSSCGSDTCRRPSVLWRCA